MRTIRFFVATLCTMMCALTVGAADYTTFLTTERGFTEVTSTDAILADANYCYILTPAETNELIVGVGTYEEKPGWASEESKALRYLSAETDPVLNLSNFFTIEKSGQYIGLRNVVYSADLFQTHEANGYMYVNTYTDKNLDEWSNLIPHWQNGYWLFENGKYPMSSEAQWKGYMGSWTPGRLEVDEPIALNRLNSDSDPAGHYRLWRIAKTNLQALHSVQKLTELYTATNTNPVDATWLITNPSFETGDETGWTLQYKDANNNEFKTREYGMSNKEGGYLMNVYQQWNDHSVSQVINNIPCGDYELSAVLCTWSDRTATLTGQTSVTSKTTSIQGVDDQTGTRVSVNVTVGYDQQLKITANSTTDWWSEGHTDNDAYYTQLFYKVDDVKLTCKGVFLNAFALPLPNDDATLLQANQWYYYDVDYGMEYFLIGNIANMQYSVDGDKYVNNITIRDVARQTTLPRGRAYFKTTRNDATLSLHPARNVEELGTFTAVALNVDGLPKKIATYNLNPDGPGEDGTKKISQYLASKGYDFIGCSEDFNYNGALMESLDGYSSGTIRNTLSVSDLDYWQLIQGKIHVDTDGLNLIWKNSKISATNESWTKWNDTESTDGNQYVNKGYRHYDVQIDGENGPVIDVFILHMDAGDTNATWSRHSQWEQLCDAINSSDHSRAKLIIGDTNSRYTREDVISHFINRLHSDFTMSDVWVEFYRNGIYPTTVMGDLTDQSDPTNYTNYEIVDKIIYINPKAANTLQLVPQSFRIEQDYTYDYVDHDGNTKPLGDHKPVVVTFKYMKSGNEIVLPDITFLDGANNTKAINDAYMALSNVTLQGRTLYKNMWNTLCLPFSVTDGNNEDNLSFSGTPIEGATVMELDNEGIYNGHKTGIEGNTLYLYFKDALTMNAGTPYIVKLASNSNDIVNPMFLDVIPTTSETSSIQSAEQDVTMKGCFAPYEVTGENRSMLYLGDNDKLYYPNAAMTINAFRAYFELDGQMSATALSRVVMNIGDETTAVPFVPADLQQTEQVYDLQGRKVNVRSGRLQGKNVKKGVYIVNGRKVVW